MRILLDSRDLINVVEHGRGTTVDALETYLRAGNHEVVLCFSTVRELAGPLSTGTPFLEIRPLLQSLERLPHLYLKEVTIIAIELQAAVDAFSVGTEYRPPSPYVRRWDHTLATPPDQRGTGSDNIVGLRLDDIVFLINLSNPGVFSPPRHHLATLQHIVESDRALLRAGQLAAKQHFILSVKKHAASHRIRLPEGREDDFARWVYSNPNRCPGLRLNHELFRSITANYGDIPEVGDFTDLALMSAIPYVDGATLDRRMRGYCRSASRKMIRFGASDNYANRVYDDVADLMRQR
jgi:hypothetical protein